MPGDRWLAELTVTISVLSGSVGLTSPPPSILPSSLGPRLPARRSGLLAPSGCRSADNRPLISHFVGFVGSSVGGLYACWRSRNFAYFASSESIPSNIGESHLSSIAIDSILSSIIPFSAEILFPGGGWWEGGGGGRELRDILLLAPPTIYIIHQGSHSNTLLL